MVLKYSFEYLSNNNTIINFLIRIADESNVGFEIIRNDTIIDFFCSGNIEGLTKVADTISLELPISIFLKNTEVVQTDTMIEKSNFIDYPATYNLPFCPKCLNEVDNEKSKFFYNPLTSCDLCVPKHQNILQIKKIENKEEVAISNYKDFFEKLAYSFAEGKKVKIQTISGEYIFESLNINKCEEILCLDLFYLQNLFVVKKSEVVALACIEKPKIKLKFNEIFKQKNGINLESTNVRFIDDLFLYLLSKSLKEHNIEFLSYSKEGDFDIEIQNDLAQIKKVDIPIIQLTADDRTILLQNSNFDNKLTTIYEKFDDKNKGHFMVLLQENNLYSKSILNFYVSSFNDDNIAVYSKEIESFLDILDYELPNSIESLFEEIQSDEIGYKLVEKYKDKFPEVFEKILNFDINSLNTKSIASLWRLVAVILDFKNDLIDCANLSLLGKGPRIDYKFFEQEKIYNKRFNFLKLIRSGMSFKLAGVDENTVALGYIESYAHFLSNIVDEVNSEIPLDGISLCGDIFANNLISDFIHKNITKNYKIYYNRDFTI